jgi:hypothetical protein
MSRSVLSRVLFSGLVLGCSARSSLELDEGRGAGGSAASSSDGAGGAGGVGGGGVGGGGPVECPLLSVSAPADVDSGGLPAARPSLVFGSNNGRVVSVFHAVTSAESTASELDVTTIEPWEAWPPTAGDRFAVAAHGGQTFAVGDLLQGSVALLLRHDDPAWPDDDGLSYSGGLSATSPQELLPLPVAALTSDPEAVLMVRGHDTPPVAPNSGYVAMLAAWDSVDPASGTHSLGYGIGTGVNPLLGLVSRPDEADLACADGRISAAAVRAGTSWLVVTSSGSGLARCDLATPVHAPTSLAVDRLVWSSPDTVDWTLERTANIDGDDLIERVRMIATADGGLALVQRGGRADLLRVDAEGSMSEAGTLAPSEGASIVLSEIVALSASVLLAHVDQGAPQRILLELRDQADVVRANATIEADGPIDSLSVLGSKDDGAALIAWATSTGRMQVARVGCAGHASGEGT